MQAEAEAQGDVLPPPTLASLPTVILEQVLTTSFPWFTLASDGRVVPPLYVAVCKAWRELALSLCDGRMRVGDNSAAFVTAGAGTGAGVGIGFGLGVEVCFGR